MHLQLDMPRQPTDSSCGPTCLHAIYRFFGVESDLDQLIAEIPQFEEGGTLSVHLAKHALDRGFGARIISYNLRIFDPTWHDLKPATIVTRLQKRIPRLRDLKSIASHHAYVEYLQHGGRLEFFDLNPTTLAKLLAEGAPVLTGLSATYLYQESRHTADGQPDDIGGSPVGHFVVVTGWSPDTQQVMIEDPFEQNPFHPNGEYRVDVHRFINAVMLGIVTYDANLLVLAPPGSAAANP